MLTLTATALARRTSQKILVIDGDSQATIRTFSNAGQPAFDLETFDWHKEHEADIPALRFAEFLQCRRENYDLIFVDIAGTADGAEVATVLNLVDMVIIPVIASFADIASTVTFLELLAPIKTKKGDSYKLLGVINKKDRTLEYGQLEQLNGYHGMQLMANGISNLVRYRRDISVSEPIVPEGKEDEFNDYLEELLSNIQLTENA